MNIDLSTKTLGCVAFAATILGDKWTPMIIRSLADGTKRFCEVQNLAGGVNPRTLSARLLKLEEQGIVTKVTHASVPPRTEYALTNKGNDLLPILEQMANWGDKYGTGV